MSYKDKCGIIGNPLINKEHLLTETVTILKRYDKTLDDIAYIGTTDGKFYIPLDRIVSAFDVHYNSGYGEIEINPNLYLRLSNGDYVRRWNSEGMEGWKYIHGNPVENSVELTNVRNI